MLSNLAVSTALAGYEPLPSGGVNVNGSGDHYYYGGNTAYVNATNGNANLYIGRQDGAANSVTINGPVNIRDYTAVKIGNNTNVSQASVVTINGAINIAANKNGATALNITGTTGSGSNAVTVKDVTVVSNMSGSEFGMGNVTITSGNGNVQTGMLEAGNGSSVLAANIIINAGTEGKKDTNGDANIGGITSYSFSNITVSANNTLTVGGVDLEGGNATLGSNKDKVTITGETNITSKNGANSTLTFNAANSGISTGAINISNGGKITNTEAVQGKDIQTGKITVAESGGTVNLTKLGTATIAGIDVKKDVDNVISGQQINFTGDVNVGTGQVPAKLTLQVMLM